MMLAILFGNLCAPDRPLRGAGKHQAEAGAKCPIRNHHRTLLVALAVSLVSSVFVAGAAVSLKPVQIENRLLDKQRSILSIAGLASGKMSAREVKSLFAERIAAKVVDLDTGEYTDKFNPTTFDPLKAARDPKLSEALPGDEDPALIKRRERFTTVYTVEKDGKLESLILPIRGYGLWSTLHGFIAIRAISTPWWVWASISMPETPAWAARSIIRSGRRGGRARPSSTKAANP